MKLENNKQSDATPRGVVLFIVSVVQFLTPFMASGVGIALPTIGKAFNASAAQLGMIEMTYLLSVSILLLPAGRFADIYGRKKVFITGIFVFELSTITLIFSNNITFFIAIRFIQGIGAALIVSTSIAILTSVFPGKGRGAAMGIITASVYLGVSTGPTLAGLIITNFGWHWIFILPFVLQVLAFLLTLVKLKGEWADSAGEKFDINGSIIFIVSLMITIFGVIEFNKVSYAPPLVAAGVIGMILFYFVERKTEHPLLDFQLFTQNRVFAFSNIATMINYASSFGITFLLSIYLQTVRNFTPQHAGLILMAQPLVQILFSFISGRLSEKYEPGKIATIGIAICAAGIFTASFITGSTPMYKIYMILAFIGLGFGVFSPSNMSVIMGSVKPRQYGVASSILGSMRTMGMLTSITIVTLLLVLFLGRDVSAENDIPGFMAMMRHTFIIFSILSVVGIGLSMGRVKK